VAITRIRLERPPLDRDSVERFGVSREEPRWLIDQRVAAAERYLETPWPRTDVGEEWRRFPLKDVPYDAIAEDIPRPVPLAETGYSVSRSGFVNLPIEMLWNAPEPTPKPFDLLRSLMEKTDGPVAQAAIRAYAEAAWTTGHFVRVPAGLDIPHPIEVITVPSVSRTIVLVERGARATVVERLIGGADEPQLAMPILDVHLEDDAVLNYVQIQEFAPSVWILGSQQYRSARASRLESFNVFVGAHRAKVGIGSDIRGDGAVVHLNGLVAGGNDQKIDFNVFQDLFGSHSESILLYLAALYDHAKAVTYGVIRVEPESRATSSYQECRNMLLSEHAGADPIPVLEILTNDVLRCGHGATAGAIDDADLFYVQSRGLPRDEAERLIVRGFFERVIEKVADADVRHEMLRALEPRIGSIGTLEAA